MAFGIMPKLGEPTTCDGPCNHIDCREWQRFIGAPCAICGRPVKPGDSYYGSGASGAKHARCEERRAR